jgi:hypothetical protein
MAAQEALSVLQAKCLELGECEEMLVQQRVRLPAHWAGAAAAFEALASATDTVQGVMWTLVAAVPAIRARLDAQEQALLARVLAAVAQWRALRASLLPPSSSDMDGDAEQGAPPVHTTAHRALEALLVAPTDPLEQLHACLASLSQETGHVLAAQRAVLCVPAAPSATASASAALEAEEHTLRALLQQVGGWERTSPAICKE